MSESSKRFAFIVGHYKAGSTWLLKLLSCHPDIRGVDETQIFRRVERAESLRECTELLFNTVPWSAGGARRLPIYRLHRLRQRLRRGGTLLDTRRVPNKLLDLPGGVRRRIRRSLSGCETTETYCRTFFNELYDVLAPPRYLLEKTPMNIHSMPLVHTTFPDAKFLAIYRDGRDVVVSDKFYSRKNGWEWSVEHSATRWRDAMMAQAEGVERYDIHTLSYESLHAEAAREVTAALGYLGLEAGAGTVEHMVASASFASTTGRKPGDERRGRFNRKGIVGDWKNHFDERDKDTFKKIANDVLLRYGYEKDADW